MRDMSGGVQGAAWDDGAAGLLRTEQLSAENHNMHNHKSRSTQQYIGNESGIPHDVGRGMGCSEFAVHGPERERASWRADCGDGQRRECNRKRRRVVYSFCSRRSSHYYQVGRRVHTVDIHDMQHYKVHRWCKTKVIGWWRLLESWTYEWCRWCILWSCRR